MTNVKTYFRDGGVGKFKEAPAPAPPVHPRNQHFNRHHPHNYNQPNAFTHYMGCQKFQVQIYENTWVFVGMAYDTRQLAEACMNDLQKVTPGKSYRVVEKFGTPGSNF